MTGSTIFMIKTRAFYDSFFKSYQSQCVCLFNDYILNKYGKLLQFKIVYYQPSAMWGDVSLIYLKVLNNALSDKRVTRIALQFEPNVTETRDMSRITTPAIDSSVIAQFFSHIASTYSFRQICSQVDDKIIYKMFQNAMINYTEKDPLLSKDQVLGLEFRVHGRIPREAVRPRKTVQVKVFGRRSKRLINKNKFLINRAEIVNPELGTFSIWIRQIV